ncbi:MAG: GyrI-like domain-containing protein [Herbiconiux sp.]|nr:GyrI-like domain-containing protein [Herbiconiux sp.]
MEPKVDFKRTLDSYRAGRPGGIRLLEVPPRDYLMVDGHGDPNTAPAFGAALELLYPVAYRLKFASKRELGRDYVVPPLEGLWWADEMAAFTAARDKSAWSWTLMLLVPEGMEPALVASARAAVPGADEVVRVETLDEGLCVQALHVGAFDDEGPLLERMHDEFIPAEGLRMTGRHHEIYLSDRRRTAPGRLRTLLRQPVTPLTAAG